MVRDLIWDLPAVRQVAVVGAAGSGKSTFIASNARPEILVVDADSRFSSVVSLVGGTVYHAPRTAATDPLRLHRAVESLLDEHVKINSIVIDSLTRMFQFHSRMASIGGRMGDKEREREFGTKNRAALMQDKADIVNVVTNLAIYGCDMYYVWHVGQGLQVGKPEPGVKVKEWEMVEKDSISRVERERLQTAVNMRLRFDRDVGGRFVVVEYARDHAGRRANTGFPICDLSPDNYWRGMMERVERITYTSFTSPAEAVAWLGKVYGLETGEASGVYDNIKNDTLPKDAAAMWAAVVTYVLDNPKRNVARVDPPAPIWPPLQPPEVSPPPSSTQGFVAEDALPASSSDTYFEENFPITEPITPPPPAANGTRYANGTAVSSQDLADYAIYRKRFSKSPFDVAQLLRAKDMAREGDWR